MVDPKTGEFDNLIHIGPGDMEPYTGQLLDDIKTVAESELISGKYHFYSGDVIYSKIRPELSKCVIAPAEGLASADAYVLRGKNSICQEFLYTLLHTDHFYDYATAVSMRTGMPKVNRDELSSYSFYAPSIKEQHEISSTLLSLDNLITLHLREPPAWLTL
jgi:type I restriction enzyme S subunit